MKTAIAFLLLVQTAYTDNSLTRESCYTVLNNVRATYAEQSQTANMNELIYNKNLEKRIYGQLAHFNGCPDPADVSDDGFHVHLDVRSSDEELVRGLVSAAGSSMMACAQTRCLETGEEIISIITDFSDTYAINGEPGTQCDAGRKGNSVGLCSRREYARKGTSGEEIGKVVGGKLEDVAVAVKETVVDKVVDTVVDTVVDNIKDKIVGSLGDIFGKKK